MFVGRYPVIVALAALLFSGLCGIGLINNRTETRPEKLWSSDVRHCSSQVNGLIADDRLSITEFRVYPTKELFR